MKATIKEEIILQVGGEGGSITLYGFEYKNKWFFSLEKNESTLLSILDEQEFDSNLIRRTDLVEGIFEGLKLLNRYPWYYLVPKVIHPDFSETIISEVKKSLEPDESHKSIRWERLLRSTLLNREDPHY